MGKKINKQADAELVRDLKQGDPAAMEEIVKRYSNKVYNLAYNLTPVSYTHLRAHETVLDLVCRLLLE